MGGRALTIRTDLPAEELRRLARREKDRAAAARMQAIAGALEGLPRAEAARLAGMERQALRDAVVRYNAEGLVGLHDRPRPGRPARLDGERRATLKQGGAGRPRRGSHGPERLDLVGAVPRGGKRWGRPPTTQGHMSSSCARWAVTAEGQALASQGGSGRTGGVRKRSYGA
jgi:hypothetical protein